MDVIRGKLNTGDLAVGIVVAQFSEYITSKLLEGAISGLTENGVSDETITVAWVPGSFELPVMAQTMLELDNYDLIICLGAVIRGETPHFEFIANECAAGISRLSIASSTPIIFGVLTVDNKEQAMKRSEEEGNNKGVDAAEAALEMIELFQDI